MGVPLNHPFLDGIFPKPSSYWVSPLYGPPHIIISHYLTMIIHHQPSLNPHTLETSHIYNKNISINYTHIFPESVAKGSRL